MQTSYILSLNKRIYACLLDLINEYACLLDLHERERVEGVTVPLRTITGRGNYFSYA